MMTTAYDYLRRNPDTGYWENGTPSGDGYMTWSPVTLPDGANPVYTDGGYAQWADQSGTQIGEANGQLVKTTTDLNGNQVSATPIPGGVTGAEAQSQLAAYGSGKADPAWSSLFGQFGVQPGDNTQQFQQDVSNLRANQNTGGGGFMDSLANGIGNVGNAVGTGIAQPVIQAVANPYTLAAIAAAAISGGASLGALGAEDAAAYGAADYGATAGMSAADAALSNAASTLPTDGSVAGATGADALFPSGMASTGTAGATSVADSALNALQSYIGNLSPEQIASSAGKNALGKIAGNLVAGNDPMQGIDLQSIATGILTSGATGALGAAGASAAGAEGLGPLSSTTVTNPLASAAISSALGGSPVGGLVAATTGGINDATDGAIPSGILPLLNAGIASGVTGNNLSVNLPASIAQSLDPLIPSASGMGNYLSGLVAGEDNFAPVTDASQIPVDQAALDAQNATTSDLAYPADPGVVSPIEVIPPATDASSPETVTITAPRLPTTVYTPPDANVPVLDNTPNLGTVTITAPRLPTTVYTPPDANVPVLDNTTNLGTSTPTDSTYLPKIVPSITPNSGSNPGTTVPNFSNQIQTPQVMIPPPSSSGADNAPSGIVPAGISNESSPTVGIGKPYNINSAGNLSSPKLAELHALMVKLGMDPSMYIPQQSTPTAPQTLAWDSGIIPGGLS